MRALLTLAAASIFVAVSLPAQTRHSNPLRPPGKSQSHISPMPQVHHDFHSASRPKDPNQGRLRGHGYADFATGYGYAGYSDFDGNRSFDPDKWNDWWHERPERAFPRWLARNQDCARPWYRGDVLTC